MIDRYSTLPCSSKAYWYHGLTDDVIMTKSSVPTVGTEETFKMLRNYDDCVGI